MGKKIECILFSFLILLLGINIVLAQDWRSYGNDFFGVWNQQYAGSYGKLDYGWTNISSTIGYTITYPPYTDNQQPLTVSTSINPYVTYTVLPNGNYIEVLDKDLNLLNEINVGHEIYGQIETVGFVQDYTDSSRDIMAMVKINNSLLNIQGFKFNLTDLSLSKVYESENFTYQDVNYNLAGIRNYGGNIYFIRLHNTTTARITKLNSTATVYDRDFNQQTSYPINEIQGIGDYNSDGTLEFLVYGGSPYPVSLVVFNEYGVNVLNLTGGRYSSAKVFKADLTNQYRVVVLVNTGGVNYLRVYKLDGSLYYSKNLGASASYSHTISVTDDYDSDTINDIYYVIFTGTGIKTTVFSGKDGSTLLSNPTYPISSGGFPKLTIADMNHDNIEDFIVSSGISLMVINGYNGVVYINTSLPTTPRFCIPSDINSDGFQDVLCSGNSYSGVFFSNTTNTNPSISSITYDPSLTIAVLQPLNMIISASDPDGDSIQYYRTCFDGDSIASVGSGSSQTCSYSSSGTYNATVYVRDGYHVEYDQFSQTITVTESGIICDNDNICETGESNSNCPNDCPSIPVNNSVGGGSGSTSLPLEIVNVEDTNQGLLPTIYYSLLIFLSYVISPVIILVFVIFAVLIFLTLVSIIKKLMYGV